MNINNNQAQPSLEPTPRLRRPTTYSGSESMTYVSQPRWLRQYENLQTICILCDTFDSTIYVYLSVKRIAIFQL